MFELSHVRGTMSSDSEFYYREGEEDFVITTVTVIRDRIPVVISKYLFTPDMRVELEGYLRTSDKNGKMFTHFYALNTKEAESNKDESRINLEGIVVSVDKAQSSPFALYLPIAMDCTTPRGGKARLHLCLKNVAARKMSNVPEGIRLKCTGHLRMKRTLEIVVLNSVEEVKEI